MMDEKDDNDEPTSTKEPVWLTRQQMASRLQVSIRTIDNWSQARVLPAYKMGRVVRYDLKECMQALRAFRRKSQFDLGDDA